MTERLEDVLDVAEVLEHMRHAEPGSLLRRPRVRSSFLGAVGELVGRLHGVRFRHADLTPRNVLVHADVLAGAEPRLWIIDLDQCAFDLAGDAGRRDNLRRLLRAVRRREERGAPFLARPDYLRFLRGYRRGAGLPHEAWKADWRAILAQDRTTGLLHRLGWWVESLFGGGAETRDGRAVVRR